MPTVEMGRVSKRLRFILALSSVVFVAVLAISPVKDYLREWKQYEKDYVRYAQTRWDTKRLLADFHFGIDQIWVPELYVVDRCTTCHQGISQASLLDQSVPQPFRAHVPMPHPVEKWGCVVCHRGQGLATEVREAHETTLAWEQPLLPVRNIQASCGVCHRTGIPETPQLNRGRELLVRLNCVGCHRLQNIDRPAMIGPDLTNLGTKVSREWIYKWLKEPRTLTDSNGEVIVNGYENDEGPRMPQFRLNETELRAVSAYLITLKAEPVEPYSFDPRVRAAWERRPDSIDQGEIRFRQMFCSTCHSIAVQRAGETKLIGGDIGPELTKIGSKVRTDWLVAWLRNPQAYLPHSEMPRYRWSDEDLYKVSHYIMSKLNDPDLLSSLPKLDAPNDEEIKVGRRIFVQKDCISCHAIKGMAPPQDFGPDLSSLGSNTISQLEFGKAKIPRTLIAYIQAKITNPVSVNPVARMPQYQLKSGDLEAITTALLSMTREVSSHELAKLVVPVSRSEFRPAGEFGELYERYKCSVCHRVNGYGGTLGPDLSFEGSRAQRKWLIEFLKNPQTLRPMLTLRMPQFNMTDQEAITLADYLQMVMQSPSVELESVTAKNFTPEMAHVGKQLYEVKYQCQSCHTTGSSGGYVGPNLSDVGNWMNAAWIEKWLKDPQALEPATIEPQRAFTQPEATALTAYLLTLKQGDYPKTSSGAVAAGGSSR